MGLKIYCRRLLANQRRGEAAEGLSGRAQGVCECCAESHPGSHQDREEDNSTLFPPLSFIHSDLPEPKEYQTNFDHQGSS